MTEKEEEETFKVDDSPHPSFVEVLCKSSGKVRRFAPGTHAGFALNLINKKLLDYANSSSTPQLASHIEAVKLGPNDSEEEKEEPISFGPNATLLNYGPPWILQTVLPTHSQEGHGKGEEDIHKARRHGPTVKGSEGYSSAKKTSQPLGLLYIGKILLALLMIFVIGAIFTLALENLPALLLYMNSNL